MNEARVYFGLRGDEFPLSEVTQLLGITPTKTSVKGERIPGKIPINTTWDYSTEKKVNKYIDVGEMASSVINQFVPIKKDVLNVMSKYGLKASLTVVLAISTDDDTSTPALYFNADTVKFLGEVGATIDIDTYTN